MERGKLKMRSTIILSILITSIITGCSQPPEEITEKRTPTPLENVSNIQITTSYNKTEILLLNLSKELTIAEEGYGPTMDKEKPYEVEAGEPIILIKGKLRNKLDQEREVWVYAYGYDSSGKWITCSVGTGAPGTATGSGQLLGLKGGQEDVFRLVMKYDRNISTIKIIAKAYEYALT